MQNPLKFRWEVATWELCLIGVLMATLGFSFSMLINYRERADQERLINILLRAHEAPDMEPLEHIKVTEPHVLNVEASNYIFEEADVRLASQGEVRSARLGKIQRVPDLLFMNGNLENFGTILLTKGSVSDVTPERGALMTISKNGREITRFSIQRREPGFEISYAVLGIRYGLPTLEIDGGEIIYPVGHETGPQFSWEQQTKK